MVTVFAHKHFAAIGTNAPATRLTLNMNDLCTAMDTNTITLVIICFHSVIY